MNGIPHATTVAPRRTIGLFALVALALATVGAIIITEPALGWAGLLTAGLFGVTIAIGCAFFAAIFAATGAQWWLPLRGVPLAIATTITVPAVVLAVVAALGASSLYPWADPHLMAHDHLLHDKAPWLNHTFFSARTAVILATWIGLIALLRSRVLEMRRPARIGTLALIVLAPTLSVAMWDWAMSLEPIWFSTMYGVYGFAGALQTGIAAVLLWTMWRQSALGPSCGRHQIRTLGSLLFGFSLFWGYIWFCQAMLIWYANLPEETVYYGARLSNGWTMLFWLNPVLNLAVPFFGLMSSAAKDSRFMLTHVALIVVLGHWLDVYLLVGPALGAANPILALAAIVASVGVLAAMIYLLRRDSRLVR